MRKQLIKYHTRDAMLKLASLIDRESDFRRELFPSRQAYYDFKKHRDQGEMRYKHFRKFLKWFGAELFLICFDSNSDYYKRSSQVNLSEDGDLILKILQGVRENDDNDDIEMHTIEEMAEQIGIPSNVLHKVENGDVDISMEKYMMLAENQGLSIVVRLEDKELELDYY